MTTQALLSAFAYVDLVDFTGQSEDLRLACAAEQREWTNFRSDGWRELKNTLKTATFDTGSFWSSDAATDLDPQTFANLGAANTVITTGPEEAEGGVAYFMRGMVPSYTWLEGAVGDLAKAKVQAVGSDGATGVVRGKLAVEYATVTATGAVGTALNLGAASASQSLYSTLHLFGTPGSSITVLIESDVDNTWAGAATQYTFGPFTTAGGRWATPVGGAITDSWFRANVSAITGTWVIACAIGIQ